MDSIPVSARIPTSLNKRLLTHIEESGMTKAEIITIALRAYLDSPDAYKKKRFLVRNKSISNVLKLMHQQLEVFRPSLNKEQLKIFSDGLKESPEEIRAQTFIAANNFFNYCLDNSIKTETKHLQKWIVFIDRTIPIFKALVESDEMNEDHRSYAYLAYALIYQSMRNDGTKKITLLEKANSYLEKAIKIRDEIELNKSSFYSYEFKQTIIDILLDEKFNSGQKSSDKLTEKVHKNLIKTRKYSIFAGQLIDKLDKHSSDPKTLSNDEYKTQIESSIYGAGITLDECLIILRWKILNPNSNR